MPARRTLPDGALPSSLPRRVSFAICQHCPDPPKGDGWIHEVKHDGHRVAAIADGKGGLKLLSRNGYDVTKKFGAAFRGLPELGRAIVLDGEVAAPDGFGITHLDTLAEVIRTRRTEQLAYFAFDLLHIDGHDLRGCALEHRKEVLRDVLHQAGARRVLYVDHYEKDGPGIFAAACKAGAEGIVSKRRGRRYRAGSNPDWLKSKKSEAGTFLVVGYQEEAPGRIEALNVAEVAGELKPCGQVRIGVPSRTLLPVLEQLYREKAPWQAPRSVRVPPRLKVAVKFFGRHKGGALRDGVFRSVQVAE